MTFKAAKCPNCAGDIQVPDDRDSVKCMYCGSDIVVREAIKLAGGVNIENLLMIAKQAESADNSQEAYKYFSMILEYDPQNSEAWLGKGRTTNIIDEKSVRTYFGNAITFAKDKENIKKYITTFLENNIKIALPKRYPDSPENLVGWQNIYASYLYDLEPTNTWALLIKGHVRLKDYKLLRIGDVRLDDYNEAFNFYRESLKYSNNSPEIIKEILEYLKHRIISYGIAKSIIDLQPLLDFAHEISPKTRILEQYLISYIVSEADVKGQYPYHETPTEEAKNLYYKFINDVKQIEPDYRPPQSVYIKMKKSACFIATAAFGSPMASEVTLLREFRDIHLQTNPIGNTFVKAYYHFSPSIAIMISKSNFLKAVTRQLLKPIIMLVKHHQRGKNDLQSRKVP